MALAAFLPALVYTYSKGILEYLDEPDKAVKLSLEVKKDIFSFIYAVDFILTQSIFLVIFSGASGVVIYLVSTKVLMPVASGIILIFIYILYGAVIVWSVFSIKALIEKNNLKSKWREIACYRCVWLILATFHILSSILFSALFIFYNNCYGFCLKKVMWLHLIIGFSVWWLIFAATIWIIPIIQYAPLMKIANSSMDKFNSE